MPDLFKLRKPFYFPPNQQQFLQALQAGCFHHARKIASILEEAIKHGIRLLADSLLPCFAYDSSRVMLYYIARLLDLHRPEAEEIVKDAIDAVESNGKILRAMSALFPLAEVLVRGIRSCTLKATNIRRLRRQRDGSTRFDRASRRTTR